jgi:D-serine deaminase-like pyridoxal phosphate-dependent protein
LGVFIKVDAGYHRTGIASDNEQEIGSVIRSINSSNKLKFKGLLSHFGNSYHVNRREEVREIYSSSLKSLLNLQAKLNAEFGVIPLSVGDTPSMSIMNEYGAVDEIRPGNFMYFDWMQYKIGSCSLDQIAAIMLCPIVAKHPERLELIIHGGAVHFSKEYLETTNGKNYGQVVKINENGQLEITEGTHLVSLSQEHGSIQCTKESFSKFAIGELVAVIPIHSCLTANLMKENTIIVNG